MTYEDSCRRLQPAFVESGAIPPIPRHTPRYDDPEPLGVNFFRTMVDATCDGSNLTLPRTFFGRCEINRAQFSNADLTESNLCWNDFIDVDFSEACLAGADLRASQFYRANFARADLRGADLRRSLFSQCIFAGALMNSAVLTRAQQPQLNLSEEQKASVVWATDDGEEPSGG